MTRAEEIIEHVVGLKEFLHTSNPYKIASYYGIKVVDRVGSKDTRPAYVLKIEGYPTIISIVDRYNENAKALLCAHELGHALLHADGYNSFDVTSWNMHSTVEYEANIFAIALLADEKTVAHLKELPPYAAKRLMDNVIMKNIKQR